MKKRGRIIGLLLAALAITALVGCGKGVEGTYTQKLTYDELTRKVYCDLAEPTGHLSTIGDAESLTGTNTLTLDKDGNYTLVKEVVLDFAKTNFAGMAEEQGAGPMHLKFTFTGTYTDEGEGQVKLSAATKCVADTDMSMYAQYLEDISGNSDSNAELLKLFPTQTLLYADENVDQIVEIGEDGTLSFK